MHDDLSSEKKGAPPAVAKASEPVPEKAEGKDIHAVVAAHGPASQVVHDHDGAGGVKTSSQHGEVKHEASHDNIHSAHLHGHFAAGSVHPEPTETPIEDHVAEHGPAHHVSHHHDEDTGKHHVTSHHGETDEAHHSVHDSHDEAHAHMGVAMGVGNAAKREPLDHEQYETADTEKSEKTRVGGGIPGLD